MNPVEASLALHRISFRQPPVAVSTLALTFSNDLDDFLALQAYQFEHLPAYRRQIQRSRYTLTAVLAGAGCAVAFVAVLGVQYLFGSSDDLFSSGNLFFYGLTGVIAAIFGYIRFPDINRDVSRKMFARMQREGATFLPPGATRLEATPEALIDTCDDGETRVLWSRIDQVAQTPDHTFIFFGTFSRAWVIPRTHVSEGPYQAFVDEVVRRVDLAA